MKLFVCLLAFLTMTAAAESSDNKQCGGDCVAGPPEAADPMDSGKSCGNHTRVIEMLFECVTKEDSECVASLYNSVEFKSVHNNVVVSPTPATGDPKFWATAFLLLDFSFDVKMLEKTNSKNQVSVRYIEKMVTSDGVSMGVTNAPRTDYLFHQRINQYEHAIVDLDEDCKIVRWDQYGDNKEQTDVAAAAQALLCYLVPDRPGCSSASA